ncbi:MAG: NAD(P)-dependent alcohol dehydrogenase [Candidatus Cyclobacteriaceae bacterium M3_2C_046]
MLAAFRAKYGLPEVLSIREVTKPTPKKHEILIRVHATTVNRTDYGILSAKPFVIRIFTGLIRPQNPVTGTDFSGMVEAVGKNVTRFKKGDRVWGFNDEGCGSQAQYFTLAEDQPIAIIPEKFSYEQAAASSEGAHYAYNFINKIKLLPGQSVLVNGATGAIGSAMVQILKYMDIKVTATGRTEHLDLIKTLGADKVIDYTQQDFTRGQEKYDFVFDAVGKSTFSKCKPLLKSGGTYISSELGSYLQNPLLALITHLMGGKKVIFPAPTNIKRSLYFIEKLIREGKFNPLIDRIYPIEQIREAYYYVASGQKIGNVVISLKEA